MTTELSELEHMTSWHEPGFVCALKLLLDLLPRQQAHKLKPTQKQAYSLALFTFSLITH